MTSSRSVQDPTTVITQLEFEILLLPLKVSLLLNEVVEFICFRVLVFHENDDNLQELSRWPKPQSATSWNNMATCNICIVQPKWHSFHRKWPGHLHRVHRYPGKHANVPNRPNRSLRVQLVNHRSLKGINNIEIIFEIWIDMGLFRNIWTGRIWRLELIFGAGSSGDGRLLSTMRNQSRPAGKWQSWA